MKLEFKWLRKYPSYRLEEEEDYLHIYKDNVIVATYYSNNRRLTQDFLKRKLNKLERIANENK